MIIAWKFRWFPLPVARLTAGILGWIVANVVGIRKMVALQNLKAAFPEWSEKRRRQTYIRCWQHFVTVGAEASRLPRFNRKFVDRWIEFEGLDVVREALKEGKGCIAVSGHFGNWEWIGAGISTLGMPVTYVVTSQTNRLVEEWMDRTRHSVGIEIVPRRNAIKGVLSALKRNRIVAILSDQDASESGVFVPFFGRLASTPRGPAVFHLKTGAPLIFCQAPFEADGKHHITIELMKFDNLTGDRENDEHAIMAQVTSRLEAAVRRHPEQWLWLHRRWKSSPLLSCQ